MPLRALKGASKGVDDTYCYVLVERDFHTGQALRRWAHGVRVSRLVEMKIGAKKGERFYIRSAENFLRGRMVEGIEWFRCEA